MHFLLYTQYFYTKIIIFYYPPVTFHSPLKWQIEKQWEWEGVIFLCELEQSRWQCRARIAEILSLDLIDLDVDRRRFQVIGKGNKQRWCFYNDSTANFSQNFYQLPFLKLNLSSLNEVLLFALFQSIICRNLRLLLCKLNFLIQLQ